jgi:hypothetical protein
MEPSMATTQSRGIDHPVEYFFFGYFMVKSLLYLYSDAAAPNFGFPE